MKRVLLFALVGMVLMMTGCGGGDSTPPTGNLRVTNNSAIRIMELYVAPTTSSSWGVDQLGVSTVPSGGVFMVTGLPPGSYDSKVVMQSGNFYTLFNISILADTTTNITNPSGNFKLPEGTQPIAIGNKTLNSDAIGNAVFAPSAAGQGPSK